MTEEAIPPDLTTPDLTTPDFLPLDEIARVVPEARVVAEAAARPAHAVAALKRVLARAPGGDLERRHGAGDRGHPGRLPAP